MRESVVKAAVHPLIAPLISIYENGDALFIAKEEPQGPLLESYLARFEQQQAPPPAFQIVRAIVQQLVELLAFGKKAGILFTLLTPASFRLARPLADDDLATIP